MQRLVFLICNLLVIASYPAYASPLSEFAKAHNVEFIAAGCLVMGIIGSIGGMLTNYRSMICKGQTCKKFGL